MGLTDQTLQCNYEGCRKTFAQSGNRKTHEKRHWPVRPLRMRLPQLQPRFHFTRQSKGMSDGYFIDGTALTFLVFGALGASRQGPPFQYVLMYSTVNYTTYYLHPLFYTSPSHLSLLLQLPCRRQNGIPSLLHHSIKSSFSSTVVS